MLPCLHCGKRPLCNLFKRCCQDQFKDKKRLIQSEKMLPGPHDIKNSFYNLARCCQDCMMAKTHCPILRQKRLFQFSKMMPRPHMMARCCHYRMWQKNLINFGKMSPGPHYGKNAFFNNLARHCQFHNMAKATCTDVRHTIGGKVIFYFKKQIQHVIIAQRPRKLHFHVLNLYLSTGVNFCLNILHFWPQNSDI